MPPTQQPLTAFSTATEEPSEPTGETPSATDAEPTAASNTNSAVQNAGPGPDDGGKTEGPQNAEATGFRSPPADYPQTAINDLTSDTFALPLCVPDGTVKVTFATIAGSGGMGMHPTVDVPDAVHDVAQACHKFPVAITGGGTHTPMGSGTILGRLEEASRVDESVEVTVTELYHENGTARQEQRTRKLGSYQLSVPATRTDCEQARHALGAWETGALDYLNPGLREQNRIATKQLDAFEQLSPADRVETPIYSTPLEVVSESFETYAVIPRGTLGTREIEVLAVVVNNPRGGYYQLGIDISTQSEPGAEIPNCYLSTSHSTPPTPNTAFTRDERFASTDLDITPITNPTDPDIVPPDEDVLESPLPEPRLRTPLTDIDGIGESTERTIRSVTDDRVSAESVAHTLFGEGTTHDDARDEIRECLTSLPHHDRIIETLRSYAP